MEGTSRSRDPWSSTGAEHPELSRPSPGWGRASSSCPHAEMCPLWFWEGTGTGLSLLPWEMPGGGIAGCAILSFLHSFSRLSCAEQQDGAEHLVRCAWWLHGAKGALAGFRLLGLSRRENPETCWLRNPIQGTVTGVMLTPYRYG